MFFNLYRQGFGPEPGAAAVRAGNCLVGKRPGGATVVTALLNSQALADRTGAVGGVEAEAARVERGQSGAAGLTA